MKRSIDDNQNDSNKKKNPIQMRNDSESYIANIPQRYGNLGDFLRDAQRNILLSQTSSSMLSPRVGISQLNRGGETYASTTNETLQLPNEIVGNINSVNNISSNISNALHMLPSSRAPHLMLNQPQQQLLLMLLNNQKKLLEEREAIERAASLYDERQRNLAIAALYRTREHLQQQIDRTGKVLNTILASRDLPQVTTSTIPILPNVASPLIFRNELIRLQQRGSATSASTGSNTNIDQISLSIAEHQQPNLSEHTSTSHGSNHANNALPMFSQPSRTVKAAQTQEVNRSTVNVQLKQPPILHSDLTFVPEALPVLLVRPDIDQYKLSNFQYLLRQQIEIFEASDDEVMTHIRGRNIAIEYGQVGLRCKHCSHVPVAKRKKGSTYFPSNTLSIYQAAQNMATTHIQCGLCEYMPESIKQQFVNILSARESNAIRGMSNSIGAGRQYWAKSAREIGLIDTEHGIRFIRSLQSQNYVNK